MSVRSSARLALAAAVVAAGLGTAPAMAGNIIQELREEGRFSTLLAALRATGLTQTVANCNSCTLFAPNNDAFAKLPAGTVEALLKPGNNAKLAAILAYHVVGSRIPASAVPTHPVDVETLNASGANIKALRSHGRVTINGTRVVKADIRANGSIIHEVGNVLWPGELR